MTAVEINSSRLSAIFDKSRAFVQGLQNKVRDVSTTAREQVGGARAKLGQSLSSLQVRATQYAEKGMSRARSVAHSAAEPFLSAASAAVTRVSTLRTSALDYTAAVQKTMRQSLNDMVTRCQELSAVESLRTAAGKGKAAMVRTRNEMLTLYSKSLAVTSSTIENTRDAARDAARNAAEKVQSTTSQVREKTAELSHSAAETMKDTQFQATAAGAVSGAVALGSSAGISGLAAGSAIGAVVGLVPAVFTFGLSIPIAAAVGGSTGLVVGTTVGGTAGALTGGVAGKRIHEKRHDIAETTEATKDLMLSGVDMAKGKALDSVAYMKEKTHELRNRLSRRA